VSSGDAGVFGMAAPALELAEEYGVDVDVVPGITAAQSGAALLGAPLGHDWCSISLSDHLLPWEDIERRLEAAASAGFVICLYNVSSKARPDHLRRACEVIGAHLAPTTVCGIAHGIGRADEWWRVLTLAELTQARLDMASTVFVGSERTRIIKGRMVTPRGYGMGDR
jgi:precorrin-3B C17-methyltransferase